MKPIDVAFDRNKAFDIIIASCGYERRSSYLARLGVVGTVNLAIRYGEAAGDIGLENERIYARGNWTVLDPTSMLSSFRDLLYQFEDPTVCIDISSMPRRMIGDIVELLSSIDRPTFKVQFAYCPAQFDGSADAARHVHPISAAPLSRYFAGGLRPPSVPIGLIVGLGLEPHRALGLIELLEPSQTWAFLSHSEDTRFELAASVLHKHLMESADPPLLLNYDIRSLADAYDSLESLVFSAGLKYRLLMAPSGPKLFSLACLLVAAQRGSGRPAVWRVGSTRSAVSFDVVEAGDVVAADSLFGVPPKRVSNTMADAIS